MPTPDNEPATSLALPVMRGFPCPVSTPFMGGQAGPEEGLGVGWANVAEIGPQFFVSVRASGGFAMLAQLDYARYNRLCHNLAAIGRQAMLTGKLDETAPNDPLHALGVALEAMEPINALWLEDSLGGEAIDKINGAVKVIRAALMLDPEETNRG